jgi:hypothetical protein
MDGFRPLQRESFLFIDLLVIKCLHQHTQCIACCLRMVRVIHDFVQGRQEGIHSFQKMSTPTVPEGEPEEFRTLRIQLGVKQLWQHFDKNGEQGFKQILLNGSEHIGYPRYAPIQAGKEWYQAEKLDRHLEVREEDGITVLASITDDDIFESEAMDGRDSVSIDCPDPFRRDEQLTHDEADEKPYVIYNGELGAFIKAPSTPFFKALGIPYFHLDESKYRGLARTIPIHPELVMQWRDLMDLKIHRDEVERLARRVKERLGVGNGNKRQRVDD